MSVQTMALDLWSGRVPLRTAFWEFAVVYGVAINVVATASSLIGYAVDAPGWLSAFLFALPLLYYLFAAVAVWRSAACYRGSQIWPELARGGVIILGLSALLV